MYESPIRLLTKQLETHMREQHDKQIFEAIQKFGVDVDRDELIKALAYDRYQYDKGYADGRADAQRWISVEEKGPVFPCVVYDGHNPPYTPSCGIVMLEDHDGKKQWIPDLPLEATLKGELPKFCRLPVTHWMPLPQPPKEE